MRPPTGGGHRANAHSPPHRIFERFSPNQGIGKASAEGITRCCRIHRLDNRRRNVNCKVVADDHRTNRSEGDNNGVRSVEPARLWLVDPTGKRVVETAQAVIEGVGPGLGFG